MVLKWSENGYQLYWGYGITTTIFMCQNYSFLFSPFFISFLIYFFFLQSQKSHKFTEYNISGIKSHGIKRINVKASKIIRSKEI